MAEGGTGRSIDEGVQGDVSERCPGTIERAGAEEWERERAFQAFVSEECPGTRED